MTQTQAKEKTSSSQPPPTYSGSASGEARSTSGYKARQSDFELKYLHEALMPLELEIGTYLKRGALENLENSIKISNLTEHLKVN